MKKYYLYHQLPNDMEGTVLYPLNQLKDIYPDLYKKKVQKYKGREHLLDEMIPKSNPKVQSNK